MVASEDKIKVVLEADASKYIASIKDAEKQARALDKALKDQEKTLKDEIAALKASGQAHSNVSREKQSLLKNTQGQINSLRQNTQALRDQTKALRDGQGAVSGLGSNMKSLLPTLAAMGIGIGGVTVAIEGLKSSVVAFGNFERSLKTIAAVSEATAGEINKIKKSSLDLGQATIFSNQQVADSYVSLSKAGFTAQESLQAMPGLLNLAAAAGGDLQNSAEIAAGTLRGFNKDASETSHIADVLAQAASKSSADIGDLGYGMKQISSVAVSANQSFEDMTALMAALSDRMIKGADAGTDLNAILIRLIDPPSEAKKALNELGVAVTDNTGKIRPFIDIIADMQKQLGKFDQKSQAKIISDIAGLNSLKSLAALLTTPIEKLKEYQTEVNNADGAAKEMADTINSGTNRAIDEFTGATSTLSVTLGEKFAPASNEALESVTELTKSLTKAIEEGDQTQTTLGLLINSIARMTTGLSSLVGGLVQFGSWMIDNLPLIRELAFLMRGIGEASEFVGEVFKYKDDLHSGDINRVSGAFYNLSTGKKHSDVKASLESNASIQDYINQEKANVTSNVINNAFSQLLKGDYKGAQNTFSTPYKLQTPSVFGSVQKLLSGGLFNFNTPINVKQQSKNLKEGNRNYSGEESAASKKTGRASGGYSPLMPVNGSITSGYGVNRGDHLHSGVDFGAPLGSSVKAPISGLVKSIGKQGAYGNTVVLVANVGGQNVEQLFAHLNGYNVKASQAVKAGDVLGQVGNSGRSTGPHLHYEVKIDGKRIDPKKFLSSKIGGLGFNGDVAGGGSQLEPISQIARLIDAQKVTLDNLDEAYKVASNSLGGYASESEKASLAIEAYNAKLEVNKAFLEQFNNQANSLLGTKLTDSGEIEKALFAKQNQLTDAFNQSPEEGIKKQIEKVKELREAYKSVTGAILENQTSLQELNFKQQELLIQQEASIADYIEKVQEANRAASLEELGNQYEDQKQALEDLYADGKLSSEDYYRRLIILSDEYYQTQITSENQVLDLLNEKLLLIEKEIELKGRTTELNNQELSKLLEINNQVNKITQLQNQQGRARNQIGRQQKQESQQFANRLSDDIGGAIEQSISAALTGDGSTNAIKQFGEAMKRILINFLAQSLGQLATSFISKVLGGNNKSGGIFGSLLGGGKTGSSGGGNILGSISKLFSGGSGGGNAFSNAGGKVGNLLGGGSTGGVSGLLAKGGKIFGGLAAISAGAFIGSKTGSPLAGGLSGLAGGAAGGFMIGGPVGAAVGAVVGTIAGVIGGIFGKKRKKKAAEVAAQHQKSLLEQQKISKEIFGDLTDDNLDLNDLNRRRQIAVRNAVGDEAEAQRTANINKIDDLIAQRKKNLVDFNKAAIDSNRELEQNLAIGAADGYKKSALERQFALENLTRETQDLLAKYKDSEEARTNILKSETLKRQLLEQQFTENTKASISNIEQLLNQRDEIENSNVFTRALSEEQIKERDLKTVDKQIFETLMALKEVSGINGLAGIPELTKYLNAANTASSNYATLNLNINGAQDPTAISAEVQRALVAFFRSSGVTLA